MPKIFVERSPFPFVKYKINRCPTEMDHLLFQTPYNAGAAGTELAPPAQIDIAEKSIDFLEWQLMEAKLFWGGVQKNSLFQKEGKRGEAKKPRESYL